MLVRAHHVCRSCAASQYLTCEVRVPFIDWTRGLSLQGLRCHRTSHGSASPHSLLDLSPLHSTNQARHLTWKHTEGSHKGGACAAAMFLMWEVSTPCVYARWFLAHIGRHNTRLYIANGLAMLATFFVARNCLGLCVPPLWSEPGTQTPPVETETPNPKFESRGMPWVL